MNNPNSRLKMVSAAVNVFKADHKIKHAVQHLVSQHPLTQSVKQIKLSHPMLDLSLKNHRD